LTGFANEMFTLFPGYFEVLTVTALIHLFVRNLCVNLGNAVIGGFQSASLVFDHLLQLCYEMLTYLTSLYNYLFYTLAL
jgi:hypothetical protein